MLWTAILLSIFLIKKIVATLFLLTIATEVIVYISKIKTFKNSDDLYLFQKDE